jgi:hypothetical protein
MTFFHARMRFGGYTADLDVPVDDLVPSDLDALVVCLGRREAECRRALGRDAAAFVFAKSHHRLGFARLGDYTRERLGVSARELQSLAQVAAALEHLPRIAHAFALGDLSWTQVRLVAKLALTGGEDVWLERARGRTVRELQALIRRRAGTLPEAQAEEYDPDAADPDDAIDGEQPTRFRLRCSRGVRRIWHQTVELARRMMGEQAAVWRAAEAIAAEGLSGAPRPPAAGRLSMVCRHAERRPPDDLLPSVPARSVETAARSVEMSAGGSDPRAAGNARAVPATIASPVDPIALDVSDAVEGRCAAAPPADPGVRCAADDRADRVRGAVDGTPIGDCAARPVRAADPVALDARMRATLAGARRLDGRIGRALSAVAAQRLHRRLGFRSIAAYARDRLGISAGKARMLLALDRRARRVPALGEAYRRGDLSWVRTLAVLPVATASTAAAWVERANEVTVRRLEAEVEWALAGPDGGPASRIPGPPPPDADLRLPASPAVSGRRELSGMTRQAQVTVDHQSERQMGAHLMGRGGGACVDRPGAVHDPASVWPADAEITFVAPRSVVVLLHEALAAFARPHGPRWRAMAALLSHVRTEWQRQPRHRDPVFARDGWRCLVPGCGSRRNLHDHHVQYRSRGGGNARENRVTICAWHHLRGIHAGRVRAVGAAPDGLTWELGVDAAGRAWLRFRGDRYATQYATKGSAMTLSRAGAAAPPAPPTRPTGRRA